MAIISCLLSLSPSQSQKKVCREPERKGAGKASVVETLLPVGLGDTLELVLLLDGVRVAAALGGVDQLLSQALGDRLDVAEGGLTGAGGEQGDGLVDAAEGRDIDGLSADGTGGTNTGAVFPGTAVDDSIDGDLDRVLVGHDVDLAWPC